MFYDIFNIKPVNCTLKMPGIYAKFELFLHLVCTHLVVCYWEKLSGKIQNGHFSPFQIYTSLSGTNCYKKFATAIFHHSKFIPVFLGKIVRKNLEQPFWAPPNLYQSVWEKFGMTIFHHSEFIPVFLGKIVRKNSEWPFQICTSLFGKNCWNKFRMVKNDHSECFLTIFLYISL